MKKTPDPIDCHVGSRLRMQRLLLKMSQQNLGEALGITFQQVQKYEKGLNRIGASRLQQIANILNVPPSFFFHGAPTSSAIATGNGFCEESSIQDVVAFVSTREASQLIRAFTRIKDPAVRKRVLDLVTTLAEEGEGSEGRAGASAGRRL